ncbi:hypothetical protein ROHU_008595 [Labeo rohita]|uniref:Uncharacterized protein n=1 Tax=Labeo rohita TaxID=84645 RepID=A0A498M9G5_LABRO|nr:hypothetical protein ROHU_008595 [Labeo rohita]
MDNRFPESCFQRVNRGESCPRQADLNRSQRCLEAASERERERGAAAQLLTSGSALRQQPSCGESEGLQTLSLSLSLRFPELLEGNWHALPHLLGISSFPTVSSSSPPAVINQSGSGGSFMEN